MVKKKKKMILLSPDWNSLGVLKYKIHRTDHFSYDGRKRYPIDNQYEIHLRLIKNREKDDLIEVFYPKGIIYFLTCFQPFSSFRGKENLFCDPNRDAFQYLTYKNGNLKRLGNSKKLKIYPSIIKKVIIQR
jgi:hypothetical protein